jgi:hypothetical protein
MPCEGAEVTIPSGQAVETAVAVEAAMFDQLCPDGTVEGTYRLRFKVLLTAFGSRAALRQAILSGSFGAADAVSMDSEQLLSFEAV